MGERLREARGGARRALRPSRRPGFRVEVATGYPSIGLLSSRARLRFTGSVQYAFGLLWGQIHSAHAAQPRRFEFLLALGVDRPGATLQNRDGRHVTDRRMQPLVVVMIDELPNQSPGVGERNRRSGPDALAFERAVETFDLPVGLSHQLQLYQTLGYDLFASRIHFILVMVASMSG
jgi:hypothetical protein